MDCCSGDNARPTRWLRRSAAAIEWAVPITALALVPKCPACLAGYIVLFTGIGVSVATASAVRWGVIGLSVGALAILALIATRRAVAWWR